VRRHRSRIVRPHVSSNGRFESTRYHVLKFNGDAKSSPLAVSDSVVGSGSGFDDDDDAPVDDVDVLGSGSRVGVAETRVAPLYARPLAPDADEATKRIDVDAELGADVDAGAKDVTTRRAKMSPRFDAVARRARRRATADMGRPGVGTVEAETAVLL
jgi:hypothetical protein